MAPDLRRHQELLQETFALVRRVAAERGFQDWHSRRTMWDGAIFALLWLSIVVSTGVCDYLAQADTAEQVAVPAILHLCFVSLFSGVMLSLAYGMVLFSIALAQGTTLRCATLLPGSGRKTCGGIWPSRQSLSWRTLHTIGRFGEIAIRSNST